MRAGHLYTDLGEGLDEERERCKELTYDYNLTRPSGSVLKVPQKKEVMVSSWERETTN
jgi:galactoside O-acetyltransferase